MLIKNRRYFKAKEILDNKGLLIKDDEYKMINNLLNFYIDYEKDSLYTERYDEIDKVKTLKDKIKHYKKNND